MVQCPLLSLHLMNKKALSDPQNLQQALWELKCVGEILKRSTLESFHFCGAIGQLLWLYQSWIVSEPLVAGEAPIPSALEIASFPSMNTTIIRM